MASRFIDLARRWFVATPRRPFYLAATLMLAALLMAFHNEQVSRQEGLNDAVVQAEILASSLAGPLAFDDAATAAHYVDALRANPAVRAVAAYDLNGNSVVAFTRSGSPPAPPVNLSTRRITSGNFAIVSLPVRQNGARLGSVYLRTALEGWQRRVMRYVGIGIIMALASLFVALLGAFYASAAEAHERLQREVEERRIVEDSLRQSQKMEAMGQLTGGVAHDFNNLLMVASGGLELLERTQDPAKRERLRDGIRQAIDRGVQLTQQLLTFARRSPLKTEVVDLRSRVRSLYDLLEHSLREDIRMELNLPDDLWPVEVDASQFDVALLNIAVNARDAMPNGGTLRIEGHNEAAASADGRDMVRLAMCDQGVGLAPELLEKVFEPFFTTKPVGRGTGLGLSQVYGFARSSGGFAEIKSKEGAGTTVSLVLPRSTHQPPEELRTVVPEMGAVGKRRVLLAEDDDGVAQVVEEMLAELGFLCSRKANAQEACTALDAGEPFDLLLSDMVMPGSMGGLDLAELVRKRRPAVPVVLMSGYSEAAAAATAKGFELLTKPCTMETLRRALTEAVERAARG